jgi:heterodisulfide reductase subunit A
MARRIRHQAPESEITVFYMDIQPFGQAFEAFFRECRGAMRFVRSRPYEIREGAEGRVRVKYAAEQPAEGETGRPVCEEEFDLVVLAVGIRPAAGAGALAAMLGVPVDGQGFLGLKTAEALPDLQREGIHAVGACEAPKDIAACIAQAEAVSVVVLQASPTGLGASRGVEERRRA